MKISGFSSEELINKKLDTIIPNSISEAHNQILNDFISKA